MAARGCCGQCPGRWRRSWRTVQCRSVPERTTLRSGSSPGRGSSVSLRRRPTVQPNGPPRLKAARRGVTARAPAVGGEDAHRLLGGQHATKALAPQVLFFARTHQVARGPQRGRARSPQRIPVRADGLCMARSSSGLAVGIISAWMPLAAARRAGVTVTKGKLLRVHGCSPARRRRRRCELRGWELHDETRIVGAVSPRKVVGFVLMPLARARRKRRCSILWNMRRFPGDRPTNPARRI